MTNIRYGLMLKTKTLNSDSLYVNIFQYFSLKKDSISVNSCFSGLLFPGDNRTWVWVFSAYIFIFSRCFLLSSNLLSQGSPPRTPCRCLMLKTKTLNNESIYVNISFSGLLLSGDDWMFLIVVRAQCAVASLV